MVQENAHSQWRGGVIRWIKQSSEKSLELGLEILAQDLFPCAVMVKTDRTTQNYQGFEYVPRKTNHSLTPR